MARRPRGCGPALGGPYGQPYVHSKGSYAAATHTEACPHTHPSTGASASWRRKCRCTQCTCSALLHVAVRPTPYWQPAVALQRIALHGIA